MLISKFQRSILKHSRDMANLLSNTLLANILMRDQLWQTVTNNFVDNASITTI